MILSEFAILLGKKIYLDIIVSQAKKVIQSCQFEKMKKMEREEGFAESVKKKTEDKKIDFFHLGPKNNYKDLLNKDIISEMNRIYKDELKEFKYE